jgi:hypothetical protein
MKNGKKSSSVHAWLLRIAPWGAVALSVPAAGLLQNSLAYRNLPPESVEIACYLVACAVGGLLRIALGRPARRPLRRRKRIKQVIRPTNRRARRTPQTPRRTARTPRTPKRPRKR